MSKLTFTDGPPVCHNCDYLASQKAEEPALTIPTDVWSAWQTATHVYPTLEILALFNVREGRVCDLHIPDQEIETAACELKEQNGHFDGMIHSHHKMSAFFSADDKSTVLPNYRYSIVTDHDGDAKAVERVTLPCGGLGFRDLKLVIELPAGDAEIEALVKARCTQPVKRVTGFTPTTHTTPTLPAPSRPFEHYADGLNGYGDLWEPGVQDDRVVCCLCDREITGIAITVARETMCRECWEEWGDELTEQEHVKGR